MIIKELEHKSCLAEEDLSELKSDMEAARMNLILSNGRVKKNGENVKEIFELLEGLKGIKTAPVPVPVPILAAAAPVKLPEGTNIDVNQLTALFASKDALSNLEKRIQACEKTNNDQNGSLGNHEDRISALEKEFEIMGSDTNSKIQQLQDLIGNMGNVPSSPGASLDVSQF